MGVRRFVLVVVAGCTAVAGGPPSGQPDGGLHWVYDSGYWHEASSPFPVVEAGVKASPSDILPSFGETTAASTPPPPISGGTLLVTSNGALAIAADPDRDRVYGVDLTTHTLAYTVELQPGDEPGRLAEDGSGRIHVALRTGGALVSFDEGTGASVLRRAVCPAPRGVAWDPSANVVWVACATGELVAMPAAGGTAVQSFVVERDLRDVVVTPSGLAVSKFRSAEVLRVSAGAVVRRDAQPSPTDRAPHVAWRMAAAPAGNVVVVHQVEATTAIPTAQPGAYGGCGMGEGPPLGDGVNMPVDGGASVVTCPDDKLLNFATVMSCEELPGAVTSDLTVLAPDGTVVTDRMFPGTLPVDVAVSSSGAMAAVAAGDAFGTRVGNVLWFTPCGDFSHLPSLVKAGMGRDHDKEAGLTLQAIAVAFDPGGNLVVQTREPAQLVVLDATTQNTRAIIPLSTVAREDTGHDVFHTQAGAMIACASCHPEGGDDGHVWSLDGDSRRTPSLRGTVAGTAPYHWPGDEPNLDALVEDVYTSRMSGAELVLAQKNVLANWVQSIPAPKAPSWVDGAAAQRGQALFTSATVGCSGCHAGAKFTNNQTMNVGTGGMFQVPPLVGVGWRTPVLHDGCALTLADRFGTCATPAHGDISSLSAGDISDLVTYLESL